MELIDWLDEEVASEIKSAVSRSDLANTECPMCDGRGYYKDMDGDTYTCDCVNYYVKRKVVERAQEILDEY